ncbi:MAG TPA: 4'-phosphopantetheinyl transferase superfamily protein [Verrucomicrobiae bacterium]|nr:4'-phosphopantetheinyl transferase superfamily protein [Verrucomicrobiae bacterium]
MKIAVPPLSPGTIHLWDLDLDHFIFNDVLSEDERARAAKFRFDHDRKRFTSGRTALRLLLASYLKANPEKIEFVYGPSGKPATPNSPVSFNLAHSGPHALLGFTLGQQLGVDVEEIREIDDMPAVAQISFSPGEFRRWQALPPDQKTRAFYRCWTRKEAYLKGTGEGISQRLHTFEVAFEAGEPPAILSGAVGTWTVIDTSREPCAAAIAYEGAGPRLESFSLASI